jgi:hypothetical protein
MKTMSFVLVEFSDKSLSVMDVSSIEDHENRVVDTVVGQALIMGHSQNLTNFRDPFLRSRAGPRNIQ